MIQKPSDKEQEYFQQQELARLKKQREAAAAEMIDAEKAKCREQHYMRCPKCGMELAEVHYRDVEVDTCFSCGGMFLDKGEIDKILEYKEPGRLDRLSGFLFGEKKEG